VSRLVPDPIKICDDVHYVAHGTPILADGTQAFTSVCRAATVTEIDPDDPDHLGLHVINPTGTFFRPLVAGGCLPGEQGGQWHRVH
jgi:hypothetical protein